jgi:hypothetical protein
MELSNRAAGVVSLLVGLTVGACGPANPSDRETVQEPSVVDTRGTRPSPASSSPLSITDIQFDPERPVAGEVLRASVSTSADGRDQVWFRYQWRIDGALAGSDSYKLPLDRTSKGQIVELTVVASDARQDSQPRQARVEIANRAPEIVRLSIEPGRQVMAGTPIVARPEGRDLDGDALDYHYRWQVNGRRWQDGGAVLETRRLKRGDTVRVQIVASDGSARSAPAEVTAQIANAPPRFVSSPPARPDRGGFVYRVAAEDPDGDVGLQFELERAPEGMEIDAIDGTLRWTPRPDQIGTHAVAVIADDLQGGRSRQSFELTVGSPEAIPAAAAD